MKCPKCGYISFDYNQTCPKCNKNISAEQKKMNFPTYQPSPPFLLGALVGEGSQFEQPADTDGQDLTMNIGAQEVLEHVSEEEAHSSENTEQLETLEEIEELGEPESATDLFELEDEAESLLLEPDDIALEDMETPSASSEGGGEEEDFSLDLDEFESEVTEALSEDSSQSTQPEEPDLTVDLDEISFEESDDLDEAPSSEDQVEEADMLTMVIDKDETEDDEDAEDLDLDLDLGDLEDKE